MNLEAVQRGDDSLLVLFYLIHVDRGLLQIVLGKQIDRRKFV